MILYAHIYLLTALAVGKQRMGTDAMELVSILGTIQRMFCGIFINERIFGVFRSD